MLQGLSVVRCLPCLVALGCFFHLALDLFLFTLYIYILISKYLIALFSVHHKFLIDRSSLHMPTLNFFFSKTFKAKKVFRFLLALDTEFCLLFLFFFFSQMNITLFSCSLDNNDD